MRLRLKDCKYKLRRNNTNMNNTKKDITVELAIEYKEYGVYITHDGDKHKLLYGSKCGFCRDYFESYNIENFCDRCR